VNKNRGKAETIIKKKKKPILVEVIHAVVNVKEEESRQQRAEKVRGEEKPLNPA